MTIIRQFLPASLTVKSSYLGQVFTGAIMSLFLLSGCVSQQLDYSVDPEIIGSGQLSKTTGRIALKVIDNRTADSAANLINPGKDTTLAGSIKQSLLNQLKSEQIKIISDPLLADLALEFQIEQFEVKLDAGVLQATIGVNSRIRLKARRKNRPFEKSFQMTRTQDVAKPVTAIDVTGVVNQLLSKQLSQILEDRQLLEFSQQPLD